LALAEAERKRRIDFQDKQSLLIYKEVGLKVLKKLKKQDIFYGGSICYHII